MNMDSEMAAMLRDSAQRYASEQYGFLQRHTILTAPLGYSAKAWQDYADLGWLGLRLPEEHGGFSADPLAIGSLMEVVGSHLLMEPILASCIVGTGLLLDQGSPEQQGLLLPRLADGSLKICFADREPDGDLLPCQVERGRLNGHKIGVLHGDIADRLIVSALDADDGETHLYLVDPASPEVQINRFRFVDGRGAANIRFSGVSAERLSPAHGGKATLAIAEAYDQATVAQCAEAQGIVRTLVARTCEYLKIRKQFGKTIGSNQALQHRAVDMFFFQEEITALTVAAQRALHQPVGKRAGLISSAKTYICSAARQVGNEAIQMHGGLGITEELDISHYFRRLMVNAALFGSRDEHFNRFLAATASPSEQRWGIAA